MHCDIEAKQLKYTRKWEDIVRSGWVGGESSSIYALESTRTLMG